MKKKILCFLYATQLVFNVTCCISNRVEDINDVKEITSPEELPNTTTKIEYLAYRTSIEKTPEEFGNYKKISDFIDNFNRAYFGVDYTNEESIFDYKEYVSSYLQEINQKNYEEMKENIVDKKIQVDYVKTNIDNIIFSSYSGNYFVDCTVYMLVKNDPPYVKDEKKYYQQKFYFYVTEENNKLVICSISGYSEWRAEETTTPYMLDEGTENNIKSIYLNENGLDKMKDLDIVKKQVEEYFKNFYTADYSNIGDIKNRILNMTSINYQARTNEIMDFRINDLKENKLVVEFKNIDYRLINYVSFENLYIIALDVTYSTNNGQVVKTPFKIDVINENNNWKIDRISYIGENFIVSQT